MPLKQYGTRLCNQRLVHPCDLVAASQGFQRELKGMKHPLDSASDHLKSSAVSLSLFSSYFTFAHRAISPRSSWEARLIARSVCTQSQGRLGLLASFLASWHSLHLGAVSFQQKAAMAGRVKQAQMGSALVVNVSAGCYPHRVMGSTWRGGVLQFQRTKCEDWKRRGKERRNLLHYIVKTNKNKSVQIGGNNSNTYLCI